MGDYSVTLRDGETATVGVATSPDYYTVGVSSQRDSFTLEVNTGAPGPRGFTGSAGTDVPGYTGSQGPIGYTGSAGVAGPTGPQGSLGYTGSAGPAGPTGSTGPQGTTGFTGSIGTTGPQGPIGFTGSVGAQGPIGYTGSIPTTLVINKTNEQFTSYASVNSVFTFDCSNGYVFNATSVVANFTPSFSNIVLGNNTATAITILLNQGATPYSPTSNVQLGSSTNTAVSWQGGSAPSGTANKKDMVVYSVLNSSGTYTVLGQLVSFG